MFQDITEYMLKSRDERRDHLKLDETCIEIGGNSQRCQGLLAHHLKTTMPMGKGYHLCHACNNAKCSNVNHLYWGTPRDNHLDQVDAGTYESLTTRTRRKMGEEAYKEYIKETSRKGGKANKKVLGP